MKQYLLSVYQPDGDPPPARRACGYRPGSPGTAPGAAHPAGAWVFSGGLHPPSTATVVHPRR